MTRALVHGTLIGMTLLVLIVIAAGSKVGAAVGIFMAYGLGLWLGREQSAAQEEQT